MPIGCYGSTTPTTTPARPSFAGFARLVGAGAPARFDSLVSLLTAQLQPQIQISRAALEADVPRVADVWDEMMSALATRQTRPAVVHGDFCPANTYLARGLD